jgi:threonine dehydrogenase-like Zn-dependent dehydrogenase
MRAARFTDDDRFGVHDIDRPEAGPDDVRIDVRAASLCGSDVHTLDEDLDFQPDTPPVTLGHEGSGVVTDVGENVTHLSEGDRVSIYYMASCGNCAPCMEGYDNRCRNRESIGGDLDGTFAEEIVVPARSAIPMGDDVPMEWGSIASCAVSTAFHATTRAELDVGDTVVVFGAGGVGLHAVLWADFSGAGRVIAVDPIESKLEGAQAYGADTLLDPTADDVVETVREMTGGWGADVTIECSGSSKAMRDAIECANGENRNESGTVVSVGLQHEPLEATYWELREGQLMVSGNHTRSEQRTILDLLDAGTVDLSHSITHHVDLDEITAGIDLLANEEDERVGRIIVDTS